MFATLLGALPVPPLPDDAASDPDARRRASIEAAIRAQEAAGLEPVTDGRLSDPSLPAVERWRFAAGLTDRAVKQALPGPYSQDRRAREADPAARTAIDVLRREIEALADAGCPLVEIEEFEAARIGTDPAERARFRDLHVALTDGLEGVHLSLSIVGGAAESAGAATILAAQYASFAFDLIAGPDDWRLAAAVPSGRGVVVGVLSGRERADEPKEILLWAAQYAASLAGRGPARVGLGSAGGYAHLPWDAAVRKMGRLGEAARLAAMPPGPELARQLDPRAVSIRTAALGHDAPPPPRRRRRRAE